MSLRSALSYKADSIIMMISFAVSEIVSLATIYLIVGTVPTLGVWTFETLAFLFGFTLVPKAIDHIFTDELWILAYRAVRRGDLDIYMTRPLNPLFQYIARTFKWDGLGEFAVGIVIMCIFAPQAGIAWTASGIIGLIVCDLSNYAKYPVRYMGKAFASIMFFVIPFGLFLYYPVECLITSANIWWSVLWSAIAASALMVLSLTVWHIGISRYESAGN